MCLDSEIGKHVGYAVGGDVKMSSNTKQVFATDGWAQTYMNNNPEMENYSGVISF